MHMGYIYISFDAAAVTNNVTNRKTRKEYTKTGLFNEYHRFKGWVFSSFSYEPHVIQHHS